MKAANFLVIGEALVDVITDANSPIEGAPPRLPGGSPTNVAVGLARLGYRVSELTSIGDDADGDLIRHYLASNGVRLEPTSVPASSTSVAFASLGPSGEASYAFSTVWDVPRSIDWTDVDVVHTGSIALAVEPGAGHVLELLDTRPDDVRVSIDPNIRSEFFSHETASTLESLFARADMTKLSHEDASFLYPDHRDVDETIDHLLDFGQSIVAITLGADGAVVATQSDRIRVSAVAPYVVDTVGAGDSFTAGLLDAIASMGAGGWKPDRVLLAEMAVHASRAAAISVGRRGADLPNRHDLPGLVPTPR